MTDGLRVSKQQFLEKMQWMREDLGNEQPYNGDILDVYELMVKAGFVLVDKSELGKLVEHPDSCLRQLVKQLLEEKK